MASKRHFEIQANQIMTEEREVTEDIEAIEPQAPAPKPINAADIDASWDGKGSLDQHREAALKEIKQPGFGAKSDAAKARKKSE